MHAVGDGWTDRQTNSPIGMHEPTPHAHFPTSDLSCGLEAMAHRGREAHRDPSTGSQVRFPAQDLMGTARNRLSQPIIPPGSFKIGVPGVPWERSQVRHGSGSQGFKRCKSASANHVVAGPWMAGDFCDWEDFPSPSGSKIPAARHVRAKLYGLNPLVGTFHSSGVTKQSHPCLNRPGSNALNLLK
jgi:hypothetical protein